jgi:hypothetical protein
MTGSGLTLHRFIRRAADVRLALRFGEERLLRDAVSAWNDAGR